MDFLAGLNERQREAVQHRQGPLLILAGAGSGKTRVITHRIARLIAVDRVPGWAILAVTFTNKAAGEMRERVHGLLETDPGDPPNVSTFHSFCVRMLRREGARLAEIRPGFSPRFSIYDDDDQVALLKAVYEQLGLDEKFLQYRAAAARISHAKSHQIAPAEMAAKAADPITDRLAVVYERYEGSLRAANALDFDDLLLESVRLLRHDPATRNKLNRRFQFVMVDEYQDTNRSQYELMRLLTEERGNVAVVGDEDQSIYAWRGADIRNILDFERDFPDATVIRLEQNYRSTKTILDAASAVVARNTERIGKWLWTESGAGEKITLYEAPDAENEALWIADQLEDWLRANPESRAAVLYRTNSQSRLIEEALRRYGRKYCVVGGFSFYQRAEVKDVLAYLKALVSTQDSVSLLRIINTPARGIGRTTVQQVEQYALEKGVPLRSAMQRMLEERRFPARAEAALAAFQRLMEELASGIDARPPAETLSAVLERTGYRKMLETEGTEEAKSRLANLEELLAAAADAAQRGETLGDFLDHAALVSAADSVDQKAQVSLLTMHNAKGLEFPVVFVAGMEDGLFPNHRALLDSPGALEEERRLCYVALTRAERRLYLSFARYRRRFGNSMPDASIPSRFLKEVPASLVKKERGAEGHVDLYAERHQVREAARRNLYTGKTYNSVENIRQFFAEKGVAAAAGSVPSKRPVAAPEPATARRTGKLRPGSTVQHVKYGRGTVMRLEGSGDDAKVTVNFPGLGLKKLVAKYAGIKVE
jgi:DNA helicase-2/ATP-dependent DNA helicase PcrA